MKRKSFITLTFAAVLLLAGNLSAQVPSVVSYQGRVQASGTNFSGTGQFKFALVSPGTNVSRQATAAATVTSGFITGVSVTDGGGGYTNDPAVTISDPTGTGAIAVAQVSDGMVVSITVQNAGSGYSASPTVAIAPPPLTIVYGTFWSNDGTSSAGSEPAAAVPVPAQQGLFTLFLGDTNLPNMQPVPASIFHQEDVRLRIWFSDGTNGFVQLSPDQRLGSVGYALKAALVSEGGVSGAALVTGSVTSDKIENRSIVAEDLSLSVLNGTLWNLNGNSDTAPGTHFLGTTDNQPLEFKVNGSRGLRIEPNTNGAPNLIGGAPVNFVTPGVVGASIGGGGAISYLNSDRVEAPSTNWVAADFGAIGGGANNDIGTDSDFSVIAGGHDNSIAGTSGGIFGSQYSTIGGGYLNDIGRQSGGSVIAGGYNNNIAASSSISTIAGGYLNDIGANSGQSAIGGGEDNNVNSHHSTIVGGRWSEIGANSELSFIGGGENNNVASFARESVIAGGHNNDTAGRNSAIGGGFGNNIGADSTYGIIGGGVNNEIGTNSSASVIAGGEFNSIANNSDFAMIPGGRANEATNRAFAAGSGARALHSGAFVWADYTPGSGFTTLRSTNANSVTFRASGGYRLFSTPNSTLGAYLAPNGGSWTSISDRNAKENFEPVNARAVLDKVATLPLSTWNYKSQTNGIRHIGPMAQDFKAAFSVGESDIGITTVDADGVALAAIQGLNQKLQEELDRRDAENTELKQRLATLEKIILNDKSN